MSETHQRTLATILSGTPGFLALKNASFQYQVVNPKFCQFLARSPEEIIGKTDANLFQAAEAELAVKESKAVMTTGLPRRIEQTFTGAQGERWFDVTRSPIFDANGDPAGVMLVAHDVTEFKKRESIIANFEKQRGELDAQIAAAQQATAAAEGSAAQLRQQLAQAQTNFAQTEQAANQRAMELAAQLETIRAEAAEAGRDREAAAAHLAQLESESQGQLATLQTRMDALSQEAESTRAALDESRARTQQLEQELTRAREALAAAEERAAEAEQRMLALMNAQRQAAALAEQLAAALKGT